MYAYFGKHSNANNQYRVAYSIYNILKPVKTYKPMPGTDTFRKE